MPKLTFPKPPCLVFLFAAIMAFLAIAFPPSAKAAKKASDQFSTDLADVHAQLAQAPAAPAPQPVSAGKRESTKDHIRRLILEKLEPAAALTKLGFVLQDPSGVSVKLCHDFSPKNPLRLATKGLIKLVISRVLFRQYQRDVTLALSYQGVVRTIVCEAQIGTDFRRLVINECRPVRAEYKQGNAVYFSRYSQIKGWPVNAEERVEGHGGDDHVTVRAIAFGDKESGWDTLVFWSAD